MSRMCCYILFLLLLTGCFLHDSEPAAYSEYDVEIPEHVRDLENVMVFSIDSEPAYSIEFERDMTFESGFQVGNDIHTYIGNMNNIVVDDENRLYVYSGKKIHVINPEGDYITAMGGEGEGPGEFRSITPVELKIHSDHLFAYDASLSMINIYSLDTHEPANQIIISPENWSSIDGLEGYRPTPQDAIQNYFVQTDSTILLGFREPFRFRVDEVEGVIGLGTNPNPDVEQYIRYYKLDMEGYIGSDKVLEQVDVNFHPGTGGGGMGGLIPHLPSTRNSLVAVSNDGKIYSAWTDDLLIKVHDADGEYLRSFYYPFERSSLISEDILTHSFGEYPEQTQRNIRRNAEFPETWPALNYMLVDDENRLWVSTITDDEENYEWWVLDEYGQLLVKFTWPGQRLLRHLRNSGQRKLKVIRNGYLYVYEVDNLTGTDQIVRYRIHSGFLNDNDDT